MIVFVLYVIVIKYVIYIYWYFNKNICVKMFLFLNNVVDKGFELFLFFVY